MFRASFGTPSWHDFAVETGAEASSFAGPSRAWFGALIPEFVAASPDSVLGKLAAHNEFKLDETQRDAWLAQVALLQDCLGGLAGSIFLEFNIPRIGRRIDVVLLVGPVVFVLEFKVGQRSFESSAIDQVWDYALDLKNFHEASHRAAIVPILIATQAADPGTPELRLDDDNVFRPLCVAPNKLRAAIDLTLRAIPGLALDAASWAAAPYRPTPTIIEAARALYARHAVEDIARCDAGAQNLQLTSRRIEELVDDAKALKRKRICFVTGVPGAGKTLVGLNLATRRRDERVPTHAVFLSGNGPLVEVLREALTRDEFARQKRKNPAVRKGKVGEGVKAFIQNVHHFRDDALIDARPPHEHVVIFDEAQRAWNLQMTSNFMRRKKGRSDFAQSEPEFLISCMDRHPDWSLVVCLVGGGQEINTGEAGIGAWLEALGRFPQWSVHVSSRLTDSEYAAGHALDSLRGRAEVHFDDSLHLAVSMRSFRAENVSAFVKALLDCEAAQARSELQRLLERFPLALTRDLGRAKCWVREHARGSERFGMLASSKAQRLKPHAIDVRVEVNPVHWFLNDKEDTRSSYYLEDAATEFQVQGLELDWACVNWDGDLRFGEQGWSHHDFRGDKWTNIHQEAARQYLRNAYRVLLTRARQGMVIFVPPGDAADPTRSPAFYDATFGYLAGLGVPTLQ